MTRTLSAIVVVLAACGPGKTMMTSSEETGVADGSWTGPGGPTGETGGDGTTSAGSGTTGSATSTSTTAATSATSAGTTGCTEGCTTGGTTTGTPGGDLPAADECDRWLQDCPEGQKCTFYANGEGPMWDTAACKPIPDDPGQHGEPCTVDLQAGNDSCDKAHVCWDVDPDTQEGTCRAMCTGSMEDPECPAAMHCILARTWVFCEPDCHPLMQNCEGGQVCVPLVPGDQHFYCMPDGSGAEGQALDACDPQLGCDAGLFCGPPQMVSDKCDPMAEGCCTPFCDLGQPKCPDKGQSCAPWFEPGLAPPGFESVGACAG